MDKDAAKELEFLKGVKAHLEDGKPAATLELEDEDQELYMKEYNLLTWKPVIYAANVSEDDLADDGASNPHVQAVRELAKEQNMLLRQAAKFLPCVQKSNRKSLNWKKTKRKNFWKIWELNSPVWRN